MAKIIWLNLQLFADGGAGDGGAGDGGAQSAAATGAIDAAAVHPSRSLEELGVPRDRIERLKKRANRNAAKGEGAITIAQPAPMESETRDAAAEEATETPKDETATTKPSWDDLMKDPDYNRRMQETVQARLKDDKGAKETLNKLAPILESLGAKYGLDASDISKMDIDALSKAVAGDDSYYEAKADELGVSPETARQLDQLEKFKARQQEQERQNLEQQTRQQHYMKLVEQAEEMKKVFPNFDLHTELQNPAFLRMTAPNSGLTVEQAYYALHHREIQQASMQATARNVEQRVAASVAANKSRPSENGLGAQAASNGSLNMGHLTKEQREGIRKQVQAAKSSGRKIYPNEIFGAR